MTAKTKESRSGKGSLEASDKFIGATTGVPVGGKIGPFEGGKMLEANITMSGPNIWAARFHQLDVEYIKKVLHDTSLPPKLVIELYPDVTFMDRGIRTDKASIVETEMITWTQAAEKPDILREANAAKIILSEPEELVDDENDEKYWSVFDEAEQRMFRKLEADRKAV